MRKKVNYKFIQSIYLSLQIVFTLIIMILALTAIPDIIELEDYVEISNDFKNMYVTNVLAVTFLTLTSFIAIIIDLVFIYRYFFKDVKTSLSLNMLLTYPIGLSLYFFIDTLHGGICYGFNSGELISIFILSILTECFAIISLLIKDNHKIAKIVVEVLASLMLFIATIIYLTNSASYESNGSKVVAINVFEMLTILFLFVPLVLVSDSKKDTNNFIYDKVLIEESTKIKKTEERKSLVCDPYEELTKLKDLLDKGIITEEEYTEKRKKYVDLL